MTKNAKARNGATEVKAPEVKENNVDPALVKEIDKELGVIAGIGEQPRGEGEQAPAGTLEGGVHDEGEDRPGSFENPLRDLTENEKPKEEEVASVYLDIPLPVGRRRYSKRREEYKDWPVGKAKLFNNYKTNPVNAVLYPLVDDGWKFQSQKQGAGDVEGTSNYIVWRKA